MKKTVRSSNINFLSEPLRRAQRELDAEKLETVARECRRMIGEMNAQIKETRKRLKTTRQLAVDLETVAVMCRIKRRVVQPAIAWN